MFPCSVEGETSSDESEDDYEARTAKGGTMSVCLHAIPDDGLCPLNHQLHMTYSVLASLSFDSRPITAPARHYHSHIYLSAVGGVSKHRKPKSQRAAPRFDVGRTVVVRNLPESATAKRITKKCKEFGEVEEVAYPVPGREQPTAFVTFRTHKEARKASVSLNGAKYKGNSLDVVLLSREGKSVSSRTLKKSRLIIRNLSFKATNEDVRGAFSSFGSIVDVHIPKKPSGALLGYAFVQFASYFSAAKAVEGMNGQELKGRPIAVDWVVPKDKFEEHGASRDRDKGARDGGTTGAGRDGDETTGNHFDNDVENQQEEEEEEEGEEEEGEEEEGEGEEEEEEEGEGEGEGEDDISEEDESDGEVKLSNKTPLKEDAVEGKTLFIRLANVHVQTT